MRNWNVEDKRKHLEFIQNVITRMNSNSFMIKGWAVTIVSALLALFASTKQTYFLVITVLPIFIFCLLDALYLQNERKFRSLYEEAIGDTIQVVVYEMKINKPSIINNKKNGFWNTLKSKTILPFYLFLSILSALCILFIKVDKNPKESNTKILNDTIKIRTLDTIKVKNVDVTYKEGELEKDDLTYSR